MKEYDTKHEMEKPIKIVGCISLENSIVDVTISFYKNCPHNYVAFGFISNFTHVGNNLILEMALYWDRFGLYLEMGLQIDL